MNAIEALTLEIHYQIAKVAARTYAANCQRFQLKKPPTPRYLGTVMEFVDFADNESKEIAGQAGYWRVSCGIHGRLLSTLDGEIAEDMCIAHDVFTHLCDRSEMDAN